MERKMLLVGNPNTGKTTLFNTLTKSDEHVGNWHGVTVEGKTKKFKYNQKEYMLTDLPGTYSLTSLSFEEQVAIDSLIENEDDVVINICDLNNLEKNLYLTLQLVEAKRKFVLFVNDTNTKRIKSSFNTEKLSKILGVKVVVGNAQKSACKKILEDLDDQKSTFKVDYFEGLDFAEIEKLIKPECDKLNLDSRFCAIKLFENDKKIEKKLQFDEKKLKLIQKLKPIQSCSMIAKSRHKKIKEILKCCDYNKSVTKNALGWFDKIATHRVFGVLFFIALMAGVFYITFFSLGNFLGEQVEFVIENSLGRLARSISSSSPEWVQEMLSIGVVGGIKSLFAFLPQIVLLFLFLSILEETGYMSRVAFLFDDIFSKLGLSGKSAYTLIMGFGCSTSAIITARNMEDKNSQIKTALLAPYMSCSAKLPIYLAIGSAFFPKTNILVVLAMYLLGIVVSIILASLLQKKVLKSDRQSLVLEFPDYKIPGVKKIGKVVLKNVFSFVARVGGVLLFVNVVVWFLQSFSFSFEYVKGSSTSSILESLGYALAPIFKPLGFGSWGAVSALLAGVIAKEVVVSSIAIFNGVEQGGVGASLLNPASPVFFTPASAISFLVFCLLYCPCISSCVVLKKEVGRKWMWISIGMQLVVAYIASFVVYTLILLFTSTPLWIGVTAACVSLIILSFVVVLFSKKKNCSKNCSKCSLSCKEN